ncbi:hypothetical protein [Streptomyces alanosinicus]|uniref:Transcriptional regulator n=1 Tax=Streptomyces alanosinicus TaxID=68171 RepID=A0A918YQK1_9ACTN|nr:hypothetical protein [Streptomyces alanosinicus]GHE11957.1 hypothetical protein GCM10010339_73540 [Streptomyces alanosinicus]
MRGTARRFHQVVTGRNLGIYETFCLHYKQAAKEVARLDSNPALASAFVSRSAFDRWMIGDIKGLPRRHTCRVLEHLLGEPAEKLFGPPLPSTSQRSDAQIASAAESRPSGPETESPHLAAMASFRLADRQLGGGHVYRSVVQYLHTAVAPGLFGAENQPGGGEDAFRAAAVLTEMAAWMAHDAGRDDRASALRLGQSLTDVSVSANVLAGMSHLALQNGQASEAADLARQGLSRIASAAPVPVLSSRLHAMEARALAQLGEAPGTQRALEKARETLALARGTTTPDWVAPFDDAALASESALALLDANVLKGASEEAERALALRDASRARSRAFGQVTLARIFLAQGQVDAACAVAGDLLDACQPVGSLRLSVQLDGLQGDFVTHRGHPAVRELLSRMTAVAQHRRLLLGSLALPEGPQ